MTTQKNLNRFLSLLIIGFIAVQHAFGQSDAHNIKFLNISIKNGLSQSSPNCIFQDSHGIMWIGTEDGLNKYDGYSFIVYKPRPDDAFSLSNSRVLAIAEDANGNLWIGTNGGGLNKYDRKNDKFYRIELKAKNAAAAEDIVRTLVPFNDQFLWIGTDKGLFLADIVTGICSEIALTYPKLADLSQFAINALSVKNDFVLIGTSHGLFRFETGSGSVTDVSTLNNNQSLYGRAVTALYIDRANKIYVGTETGVSMLDEKAGTFRNLALENNSSTGGRIVKALLEDTEGRLWIATYGNGLFIGSPETDQFVNYVYDHLNPYSIKNNEVLSLYRDFAGLIWAGSNGIDIYSPRKDKFVLYDYVPYTNEQLVFRNIHPIYEDKQGVLWVGSKTDGLHILDRLHKDYSRWIHREGNVNSLSSSHIRAIKEFPEGTLWIGTEDAGMDKVKLDENRRPISFTHFKHDPADTNSITSNRIYSFFVDTEGKLWIGTDNGLSVMNIATGKCKQYTPDPSDTTGISNKTVYTIYGDSKGNIWLATDMGVNLYDRASDGFIHYIHDGKKENSVIHNEILCFHEDAAGKIWIGTYGKGFDKFDPVAGKFYHFTDLADVETAVVYGILDDQEGNLWMSTNNGILKFNEKTRNIKQFTIEDGLQSNEFNGTSYHRSNKGEIFFGGQFGFNSFFPHDVQLDTIPPKIVLSDLQVRNVSIQPGDKAPISSHINVADEIVLNYNENNFTLYFSALHFENPLRNRYKYKLEGFDKDWIDAGNRRFVSYTNLPYKSYKFRVIASNSDGIWNEKGIAVRIKVRPPFWATLGFRLLVGLLLAGLIFYIIRRRLTMDERQKKIIEEKFQASSLELEKVRTQMEQQHKEIVIQKRELIARQKDQENLLWFNQGLGIFSELISKNRENLVYLCKIFIEKLVEYVEAQQGGVFLLNNEDDNNVFLELTSSYCFSSSREGQSFQVGEGYVGSCFRDKKFIEIDNLSENYSILNSGLGNTSVKHLILGPLVVNNECIGVIELGSFKKIKGYRITFIEKLLESFASTIITEQSNKRLTRLIDQSTQQARDLAENEEKIRQNMEELLAAHEESSRREDELVKLAEESATREEMLNQEIEQLKSRQGNSFTQPLN